MKSSVNFDHERAFSTFGLGERVSAREEGVNVWRMALLRPGCMVLLHPLLAHSTCTSTCTLTTNLASTARMINFVVYVIHIRAPFFERRIFYSRAILKSSRTVFAHLVLCAAFSIREPFWKTRDLYSRAFFWAQRFLFARHSKSSRSLFARLDDDDCFYYFQK